MFNRKLLAIILLVALTATLAVGCGSNSVDSDNPAETVELIWYTGFGGTETPKDMDKVLAELNKYTKEKINATVKIIPLPFGDYEKKMNPILSSGETCDLVFTCSWTLDYRNYASKGMFYPLDDLIPKYGAKLDTVVPKELWEVARIDGKIIAVPNYKDLVYQQIIVFNKNLADKLGLNLSSVKSFADLSSVYAIAHAKDPNLMCFGFQPGTAVSLYQKYDFINSFGMPGAVALTDKSCKVVNQCEDPEFINVYKIYHEFYNKGYISKEASTSRNEGNLFTKAQALSTVDVLIPNSNSVLGSLYGFPVETVKIYDRPAMTTHSTSGSMIAISATSKNPARAMRFLELLNTDPYVRNMVAYGIEGVHYDKTGPTSIKFRPEHKNYEMMGFALGNRLIEYTVDPAPPDSNQLLKAFNDTGIISPILGFGFNPEPVKSEISAIKNCNEQYAPAIYTGMLETEPAVREYIAQLKSAGLDKVLAEMQKQIDEWKKMKK